jgi:hypothetical protein
MSQAYPGKSSNPPPTEYWPSRETWQVDTSKGQNKRGDDRWKMSTLEAEKKVNDAKTFTTVLSLSQLSRHSIACSGQKALDCASS